MGFKELTTFVFQKLENELSPDLTYHGLHHTHEVLECCRQYADRLNISEYDANLLYTAALFHDIGFTITYDNHEEASIQLVQKILPDWQYTRKEIETVSGIIRATKIPQKPNSLLEKIIADADLDYLGTDKFYSVGKTLLQELKTFNKISDEQEWNRLQVQFLKNHHYHTEFALKYREPVKKKHLQELIRLTQ